MDIEFFGGNCFRIKTKQAVIVIDDCLAKMGKKTVANDKAVAFYTADATYDEASAKASRLVIQTPGEFEVGDVTVRGVAARAHMDTDDQKTATVYQFMYSGQTVSVLGHIHPDVSGDVLELVSGSDVLIVPVGGNGFTLDPVGATQVIKKAEPAVVIPSQYHIDSFAYEVPAQTLEDFAKVASLNLEEPVDSFKVGKSGEEGAAQTRVVVLAVK